MNRPDTVSDVQVWKHLGKSDYDKVRFEITFNKTIYESDNIGPVKDHGN